MALRDFSYYFFISNLVAVMIRFLERGTVSPSENSGVCRAFHMALLKKGPGFFFNYEKIAA
jgi:hypothetical protein